LPVSNTAVIRLLAIPSSLFPRPSFFSVEIEGVDVQLINHHEQAPTEPDFPGTLTVLEQNLFFPVP
jgi:hypothetical protein